MDKNKKEDAIVTVEESPVISDVQTLRQSRKKRSIKGAIRTAKKIIAFGKPFHGYLYLAIFSILVETFFELLAPVFLGKAIDCIVYGSVDFSSMMKYVL